MVFVRLKVLLYLFECVGKPLAPRIAQDLAFLVAMQGDAGGDAFYRFVPGQHGPQSFQLDQELPKLIETGVLKGTESGELKSVGSTKKVTEAVPYKVRTDVFDVVRKYGQETHAAIMRHVRIAFPWFTALMNGKAAETVPSVAPAIYTAGYEGVSIDTFLDVLLRNGIRRVIDVRHNPVARRYGFHKKTFSALCGEVGLDYEHVRELGIISSRRRNLSSLADYRKLFEGYVQRTLPRESAAVERVGNLLAEKPSVLVCMEGDPRLCHRSRLADRIRELRGLEIVHLEVDRDACCGTA